MALFQDAVEITDNGNNKQVKTIKDSNGNIIWGSQSAFPYRRLEYLQGNNMTYGFNTAQAPQLNSYMQIEVAFINDPTVVNSSWQMGRGAVSANQRFAVGGSRVNNDVVLFGGLGNSWNTYSNISLGETKHTLTVQGPNCNKFGNGQGYSIDGTFYSTSNTVNSPSTWYTVYLMGSRGNTNDSSASQGEMSCKLYYAQIGYNINGINAKIYPVQRKLDGAIGLLRVSSTGVATFMNPRTGETGTLTAGPVIDEYFDWNA